MPGLEIEDEREQEARRIVAHSSHYDAVYECDVVIARDNRDDMWQIHNASQAGYDNEKWTKLPPLPES